MHILFLTHYYPPEVSAPAARVSENAKAWAALGHKVTIVTSAPNHPKGRIHAGYKNKWITRQTEDGVTIIRIWTIIAANRGFFRRVLKFVSFPLSVLLHLRSIPTADVVVSTSPPFFAGLAGWLLKRSSRPWVFEIRDLYPESIVAVGAMSRGPAISFLEWLEKWAYNAADGIVSLTDSFVPHILQLRGRGLVGVIKNGVDLQFFNNEDAEDAGRALRRELGLEGKFVAAYVGTHGAAHGLGTVLEAAELLRDNPEIVFLMVGDGSERERLIAERAARGLENVLIIGERPKSDMPAIWNITDASLVLLRRRDAFKLVLPSKMFEAMAMRRPMILGVEGEARALLEEAEAGIPIIPEDSTGLAASVQRLAQNREDSAAMAESGRRFVEANFNRARLAERYVRFLETVVAEKRRRQR